MHRFFIDPRADGEGRVFISGGEANHALRVLRLSAGERILVFDGSGKEWEAEITEIQPHGLEGRILRENNPATETNVSITLVQVVAKGEHMDFLLQKGTELGVKSFIPVLSSHTVVRILPEDYQTKQQRWQNIVLSATKQCGRVIPPRVGLPLDVKKLVSQFPSYDHVLLCWEKEHNKSLKNVLTKLIGSQAKQIMLIVGPEGGWAPFEVDLLCGAGAKTISLGSRILRTETAGLVLTTTLLYHLDEI